jgi:hypothetical protein
MNIPDRKQLYNKVVYVYFCFFSMFTAQRFSMTITYGAALFFSLSAFSRILGFSLRTAFDPRWLRFVKTAIAVFFVICTVYIIVLYPFLFRYQQTAYAIGIIVLPFLERAAENMLLRSKAKIKELEKADIAKIILPIEFAFTAAVGLISLIAGLGAFTLVLASMVLGMAFNFFRQYIYRDFEDEYPSPAGSIQARSAKLYDGMVMTSGAALNIFAFTYILFIMLSIPHNFFLDFYVVFGGLALVFASIYIATYRVVNAPLIQKIGKNAAFVLGTAVSIFAVYVFRDSWFQGVLAISVQTVLLLFGIVLQMTATLGLKEDVLLVLKLADPDVDENALGQRTARLEVWTSLLSEAIFLLVLLVIITNPLFYMMDVGDYIEYAPYVGSSIAVIPTFFLFMSLIYSMKQPLTKKFGRRLKAYEKITMEGKQNPDMEKRLKNVLIKRYKKRIGVHIIRAFLKGIMFHTVTGKEHVKDLPGVFVFNHGEVYGPIAAVVFMPYDIRPWILNKMIDKNEITKHIYDGTFGKIKWLPAFFKKFIAKALSPVIIWGLHSFDPIPVYRGATRNVIKTFTLSVECLNSGDSILLFPENPEENYGDRINEFYSGFASLGRMYYRAAKKCVTFYPVYASKQTRALRIGEGVTYDPKGKDERERIVKTLKERMVELKELDEKLIK